MQLLFKLKALLLKFKKKNWIIFGKFFNIHISHLTLHSMINKALKWHHKNISNKIIVFIEFLWSPDVLFGLFDCDYTLPFIKTPNSWLFHITRIFTLEYIVQNLKIKITFHFIIFSY